MLSNPSRFLPFLHLLLGHYITSSFPLALYWHGIIARGEVEAWVRVIGGWGDQARWYGRIGV